MDTNTTPQIRDDGLGAERLISESEASRELRISQMEIEAAVEAKGPNQMGRVKKLPGLDRIVIDQAFKERKINTKSV